MRVDTPQAIKNIIIPVVVVIILVVVVAVVVALVLIAVVHPSRGKTPVGGKNSPWRVNIPPPGGTPYPRALTTFPVVFFPSWTETSQVSLLLLLQVGHATWRRGRDHVWITGTAGGWSTSLPACVRGRVQACIAHQGVF